MFSAPQRGVMVVPPRLLCRRGFLLGSALPGSIKKGGPKPPFLLCGQPSMVRRVVDQLIELAAALALVTTSGGRET